MIIAIINLTSPRSRYLLGISHTVFLISPTTLRGTFYHPSWNPRSSHQTTCFSGKFPDSTIFASLFKNFTEVQHTLRKVRELVQLREALKNSIHLCTLLPGQKVAYQHLEDPLYPLPVATATPLPNSHYPDFQLYGLIYHFYSFSKWNLKVLLQLAFVHSVLFVRFIALLSLFITILYSIVWIYHSLFSHCTVDGHLGSFQSCWEHSSPCLLVDLWMHFCCINN